MTGARALLLLLLLAACGDEGGAPSGPSGGADASTTTPTDPAHASDPAAASDPAIVDAPTGAAAPDPAGTSPRVRPGEFALDAEAPGDGPWFVPGGAATGIDHQHRSGPTASEGKFFLRDTIGAGVAVVDVDDDGRLDLYFAQGGDGTDGGGDASNRLYRNLGDRTFEEVGASWGLDDRGFGFGALAFDEDNDGDADLLVTNLGPDRLYRDDGELFTDVTDEHPGLAGPDDAWSTGAAAGDVDGDGDLDLYVASYCEQDLPQLRKDKLCRNMGCKVPCGPIGLQAQADRFFANGGAPDYRLQPADSQAGFAGAALSYGFQPTFTDVDADGDLDLYVTNDSQFNWLWINDGTGRFTETGLVAGVACGRSSLTEAGMGLAVGHADDDPLPEIYVTNFSVQNNNFFSNRTERGDDPWFYDVASPAGVGAATWFKLGWGCNFADLDADGLIDLFVSNGHIYHQVDDCDPDLVVYRQQNQLFRGRPDEALRFDDHSRRAGPAFGVPASHRASVVADLDDDGRLDLVVTRLDETPLLAWNETPAHGHWLGATVQWRPDPDGPWTCAVGARVTATAGGRTWTRDVHAGSSFLSNEDPRVHFGLGDVELLDRLVIAIPGGPTAELRDVAADRYVLLRVTADGTAELVALPDAGAGR